VQNDSGDHDVGSIAGVYQTQGRRRCLRLIGARCTGNIYQTNSPDEECLQLLIPITQRSPAPLPLYKPTTVTAHLPLTCIPTLIQWCLRRAREFHPSFGPTHLSQCLRRTRAIECLSRYSRATKVWLDVCFYPDESKLVSGSSDKTLRIWNRKTGAVEVLSGHTDTVWDVDVSPDGKMVVSGSMDKTVRIWDGASRELGEVFTRCNQSYVL
jgi:WD40 repeat protein